MRTRGWTRRRPRAVAAVVALVAVILVGSGLVALAQVADQPTTPPAPILRPNARLAAGSGLVAGGATGRAVSQSPEFQSWLDQGVVPSPDGPYAALATTALADLYSLTLQNGGVIASTAKQWHYVWPRDAAFAAAAFARTGHLADAVHDLEFLQTVQAADGSFQARYLVDGSGPPDSRGLQEDGPGWALWAVDEVVAAAPLDQRSAIAGSLSQLVDRSLHRLVQRTDTPGALPGPSADYWEVAENQLTLGIAAPTLVGLLAGSRLVQASDPDEAAVTVQRATTLRASIERDFGSSGYSRYAGGRGPDAAVTFTLPPYVDAPLSGAVAAARTAAARLRQPGGGVSPGATWRHRDGVSWTPESGLFLLAAAGTADRTDAETWLSWFARVSSAGTIPEKVDQHGRAAPVSPLGWSDALVLLALDQLDLLTPSATPTPRSQ